MPRKTPRDIPSEFEEQCALVDWLELKKLRFSALPLSTYTSSWAQKVRNYKSGVRPGVPDLLILTPKGLLFVELKRRSGSYATETQKEWIEDLNKLPGVEARICRGYEEAVSFISQFL